MSKHKDGGPAFPVFSPEVKNRDGKVMRPRDEHAGMSLRDYFAGQAIVGMHAHPANEVPNGVAQWAYAVADAMLIERGNKGE